MRILLALCLVLCFTFNSFAQTTQPSSSIPPAAQAAIDNLDAIVILTDEQKATLAKSYTETAQAYAAWTQESQAAYKQLEAEMQKARETNDKQAINDILVKGNAIRRQGLMLRHKMREATMSVMTKEQLVKFEANTLSNSFLRFMKTLVVMDITPEQVKTIHEKAIPFAEKMQGLEPALKQRVLVSYRDTIVNEVFTKDQQSIYKKAMAIKQEKIKQQGGKQQ